MRRLLSKLSCYCLKVLALLRQLMTLFIALTPFFLPLGHQRLNTSLQLFFCRKRDIILKPWICDGINDPSLYPLAHTF